MSTNISHFTISLKDKCLLAIVTFHYMYVFTFSLMFFPKIINLLYFTCMILLTA